MIRSSTLAIVVLIVPPLCSAAFAQPTAERPAGTAAGADVVSPPDAAKSQPASDSPRGFFEIVFSGGWVGFLIILFLVFLSIGGLALAVEQFLTLRERVLIPPDLSAIVTQHLNAGDLAGADRACQERPSVLAFVLRAGMAEVEGGWPAVEKAMEDAIAEQAARLMRKIEYLSVLGNIAPMVGLLGTVIGMIFAFQEVADTQGAARAAELASGIYQALVTTVGGLLVAIPALGAYAVFRNRADQLIAETAYAAQHSMLPIKRANRARRVAPAPSRQPPPN